MSDAEEGSNRYRRLTGLRPEALMSQGIPTGEDADLGAPEISGFEIQELIGRGGMGAVYLARQIGLDRPVAIKRVAGNFRDDPLLLDRLAREAQTMAKLQHANIVTVHQFEKLDDGGAVIIMEYVVGGNLRDLIDAHPQGMPIGEALRLIREIASALSAAHDSGIVHRDMKPENVLIDQNVVARVTDFGLALPLDRAATRLTMTGTTVGTIDYLAPERLAADVAPDTRADVYAIGVMLYEMLTGQVPRGSFDAPRQIRPGVPRSISDATMRALRANPGERFATMAEFTTALERGVGTGNRRRWLLIAAAAAAVALVAGGLWKYRSGPNPPPAAPAGAAKTDLGWHDVLGQADLERDVLFGGWKRDENGHLVTDEQICVISLEREMAESYEVHVRFVRLSGIYSIGCFFTANRSVGTVSIDSWDSNLNGVQTIGGDDLRNLKHYIMALENGRLYDLLIRVRPGLVTITLDGEFKGEFPIGTSNLGVASPWNWNPLVQPSALAIGSWKSPSRFEKIEWRTIESGPGDE